MFKQKGKALELTLNDQKLEVNSGRKSFWNNIFIITISNLVITVLFWISNRFQIVGIDLWTCFFFSLFVCWVPLQELFIPINLAVLEPNGFDFFVRDKIIPFMYRKYQAVWNDVAEIYSRKIVKNNDSLNEKNIIYLDGRNKRTSKEKGPDIRTIISIRVSRTPLVIKKFSLSASHPKYYSTLEYLKKKVDPLKIEKETLEICQGNLHIVTREEEESESLETKKFYMILTGVLIILISVYYFQQTKTPHIK